MEYQPGASLFVVSYDPAIFSLWWLRICSISPKVTCHILHEHISLVAKRLAPMRLAKSLDESVSINQHTCIYVCFWNFRGCVKFSHQNAFGVEFISRLRSASESGLETTHASGYPPFSIHSDSIVQSLR
ncbi:hypothetical protein LSAT2_029821 [Lamellibrachia satsuma]|nr:hypothetical protein LSAT2_029821 [Lamellibrachia satsuma]